MAFSKDHSELETYRARLVYRLTPKRANGRRLRVDRNAFGGGWKVELSFGPGAGYVSWNADRSAVLVYGRTLYVAWKSGSRTWQRRFRGRGWWCPLELGITRNAGRIPYCSH